MAKKQQSNLLERAKKVGLSDEQIESFPNEDALRAYLDRLSPATNPDARPKEGKITKKKKKKAKKEKPERVIMQEVDRDDRQEEITTIESIVRRLNVKHNSPGIESVRKVIEYDAATKQLTKAEYTVTIKS